MPDERPIVAPQTGDSAPDLPPATLTHRDIVGVLSGVMLGMLLAGLDNSIVATALPTVARELDGVSHMSWIVSAYMLCATIATPIYGKLSDLYGRKRMLQTALVIFGAASVFSALAQTMPQLIAARAMQGLGGGGLIAMAQATVGDVLAPRERGKYQAYFAGVFATSGTAGPLLGGFFTDYLSWRFVFWINVPIVIVAWLLAQRALSKLEVRTSSREIDYGGAALLIVSVLSLMLVATWGGLEYRWTSPVILGLALCGLAFAALFVLRELVAREPILPPRMFRNREFSTLVSLAFLAPMMTGATIILMPLYLQLVSGASASRAGLFLMAMTAGMVTGSFISGRAVSLSGQYKLLPVIGFAVQGIAFTLLSNMTPDTPRGLVALFAALVGTGSGFTMSVVTVGAQNAIDPRDLGAGSATGSFFRNLGSAFGVAALTSLLLAQLATNLAAVPGIERLGPDPSLELLRGGAAVLDRLGPAAHVMIATAADNSFGFVFTAASFLAVLGFGLALSLRGLPLRKTPSGQLRR
jgi:EmrB/QacA subfamily drug resistance transporter